MLPEHLTIHQALFKILTWCEELTSLNPLSYDGHPYFTDEETDTQRLSNVFKVILLGRGGAKIRI